MNSYKFTMFLLYFAAVTLFWIVIAERMRIARIVKNPEALLKERARKFPRITFIYTISLYLYLLATALLGFRFHDHFGFYGQRFYFAGTFFCICCLTGIYVSAFPLLYKHQIINQLKNGWIMLKTAFLPFFLLNAWLYHQLHIPFVYTNIGDAFGYLFMILLAPYILIMTPIILSFLINMAFGWIGIKYIQYLRSLTGDKAKPSWLHFILQMIPLLDAISMIIILTQYKNFTKLPEAPSGTAPVRHKQDHTSLNSAKMHAEKIDTKTISITVAGKTIRFHKISPRLGIAILACLWYLCAMSLFFYKEIYSVFEPSIERRHAEQIKYTPTEEEEALLKHYHSGYWDRKKIEAHNLSKEMKTELDMIRLAADYIKSHYPETSFYISSFGYHPTKPYSDQPPRYHFHVYEKNNYNFYMLWIYPEQNYAIQEDLYVHFYDEKCNQYIENILGNNIEGFSKAIFTQWNYVDEGDHLQYSAESILNGECAVAPKHIGLYIAAEGKSPEECEALLSSVLQQLPALNLSMEYRVIISNLDKQSLREKAPNIRDEDIICNRYVPPNRK